MMIKADDTIVKKDKEKDKQQSESEELQSQLDETRKKLAEVQKQLDETTAFWKRALADYQNLVKRTETERKDFVQFAVKSFIEKLISTLDDLELAQKHLKDNGLGLAIKKLNEMLKQEGLERIETVGKKYDIHSMEAISIVSGKEDNVVVTQHRAGYLMHQSVLRPAQVTVSKKK